MDYFRRFTFLFAAPAFDADNLEGIRFNQIVDEIQRSGFEVVRARKLEDAAIAVQTDAPSVAWWSTGQEGNVPPRAPSAWARLACSPRASTRRAASASASRARF